MYAKVNISNTYISLGNAQNKGLQVLTSDFTLEAKKTLIRFIENSVSQYSEFTDIIHSIYDQCINAYGGKWTISIGEINKINSHTNADHVMAVTIGPYKIIITYCA